MKSNKTNLCIYGILPFLAVSSCLAADTNGSSDNFYVAIGGGKSFSENKVEGINHPFEKDEYAEYKLEKPNVFKAAAGIKSDLLRGEFEFLHFAKSKSNELSTETVANLPKNKLHSSIALKSNAYFINAYYDIKTINDYFEPYVGLGIGLAKHNISCNHDTSLKSDANASRTPHATIKNSTNSFAWNISAGTAIKLSDNLSLDISYKHVDLGKVKGTKQRQGATELVKMTYPSVKDASIKHHTLMVAARVSF